MPTLSTRWKDPGPGRIRRPALNLLALAVLLIGMNGVGVAAQLQVRNHHISVPNIVFDAAKVLLLYS